MENVRPDKVAVIGSGNMGASIAELLASNGKEVLLVDLNIELLENAQKRIRSVAERQEKFLSTRSEKEIQRIESLGITLTADQKKSLESKLNEGKEGNFADRVMKHIHPVTSYQEIAGSSFVFEAIFEKIEVKKDLLKVLSKILDKDTIVASNTSSLSISEFSNAFEYPEQVIISHFFNPPYTLPLVEVVPGIKTSSDTVDRTIKFISGLKNHRTSMKPVLVRESPGFVVNRILVPMINEAISLYGEGVASKEDIDLAMKLGAGMPMGPLELADMVGLDVLLDVAKVFEQDFGDQKYSAPYNLKRMVWGGYLGRKSGKGIYDY